MADLESSKTLNCGIEYLIGQVIPNFRGKCCDNRMGNMCLKAILAYTVEYFITKVCPSYACLTTNFQKKGFTHGKIFEHGSKKEQNSDKILKKRMEMVDKIIIQRGLYPKLIEKDDFDLKIS